MFNSLKLRLVLFVLTLVLLPISGHTQALSLLSQPQVDLGRVLNADIKSAKVSANGRYASFLSNASNVVINDENYIADLFIKDFQTGNITRVNTTSSGTESSDGTIYGFSRPTDDGRYVAFIATDSQFPDYDASQRLVYLKDLQTDLLTTESKDGNSQIIEVGGVFVYRIHLSIDGRYITFTAETDVTSNDLNTKDDVYRKDLQTGAFELISVANTGQSSETGSFNDAAFIAASSSGRYAVFSSRGRDIVSEPNNGNSDDNVYLRDNQSQTTQFINVDSNGFSSADDISSSTFVAAVSNNGQVAFCSRLDDLVINDNNGFADVFYFDGVSNTRISLSEFGDEITDKDCSYSSTRFAGVDINSNGSMVSFVHESDQLLSSDDNGLSDVFIYNTSTEAISLVSKNSNNEVGDGHSHHPQFASDDQQLIFLSLSSNLAGSDSTGIHNNIFRYFTNTNQLVYENTALESPVNLISDAITPKLSSDSNSVLFASYTTDLINNDRDNNVDLFLLDRQANEYHKVGRKISRPTSAVPNGLSPTVSYYADDYDLSSNGRFVVFNSSWFQPISTLQLDATYLFIYDTQTAQYTQLISGVENPKVNNEGHVVFSSSRDDIAVGDTNMVEDVFL